MRSLLVHLSHPEPTLAQGERRAAVLHSVGVNAEHGARRTNTDKRRAVMALLKDEEQGKRSAREIAKRCRVSHDYAARLKADYQPPSLSSDDSERTYTTKHGIVATMKTAAINTVRPGRKTTFESAKGLRKPQPREILTIAGKMMSDARTSNGKARMGAGNTSHTFATPTRVVPSRSESFGTTKACTG